MTDSSPSLTEVRVQIDTLDRQIVGLIAERQKWVVEAGKLKSEEAAVRAPDRVEQVISKVRGLAADAGASPDVVERAYRALVSGFIEFELRAHRGR
ncbi:chorismate mutase [Microbacterium aurum]